MHTWMARIAQRIKSKGSCRVQHTNSWLNCCRQGYQIRFSATLLLSMILAIAKHFTLHNAACLAMPARHLTWTYASLQIYYQCCSSCKNVKNNFQILPVYSGKQIVKGDLVIFSAKRSFLLRKRIIDVSVNHLLLQMESNSFILSIIRFCKIRTTVKKENQTGLEAVTPFKMNLYQTQGYTDVWQVLLRDSRSIQNILKMVVNCWHVMASSHQIYVICLWKMYMMALLTLYQKSQFKTTLYVSIIDSGSERGKQTLKGMECMIS